MRARLLRWLGVGATCARCHLPAPEPEHLYRRHDGSWYCLPCIVERYFEAEMAVIALATR